MKSSLTPDELVAYSCRQLDHIFPDGRPVARGELAPHVEAALVRLERCFAGIKVKYYFDGTDVLFDHLHTDQYATFLYFLSNTIYREGGDPAIAAKVYALNKALHGIDLFYEVALPDIFVLQHLVGTVLGRAQFGNYFYVYQGCSVGGNVDDEYPVFGQGVVMYAGSAILGRCRVGDNCWFSAGVQVKDTDIPSNTVTFGQSPHLVIKPTRRDVVTDLFGARSPTKGQTAGEETTLGLARNG